MWCNVMWCLMLPGARPQWGSGRSTWGQLSAGWCWCCPRPSSRAGWRRPGTFRSAQSSDESSPYSYCEGPHLLLTQLWRISLTPHSTEVSLQAPTALAFMWLSTTVVVLWANTVLWSQFIIQYLILRSSLLVSYTGRSGKWTFLFTPGALVGRTGHLGHHPPGWDHRQPKENYQIGEGRWQHRRSPESPSLHLSESLNTTAIPLKTWRS